MCLFFDATAAALSSSSLHSAELWTIIHGCHLGIPPASFLAGFMSVFLSLCLSPPSQSESSPSSSSSELGPSDSEELGSLVLASEIMPSELSISMDVSDRYRWMALDGWLGHTHAQTGGTGRHAARGGKSIAHTHTPGYAFMHDTFMNYLCTCMCISHTQWDRTKTSRQHKHSSRDKGLALHRVKLSQTESGGWTQNLCLHI